MSTTFTIKNDSNHSLGQKAEIHTIPLLTTFFTRSYQGDQEDQQDQGDQGEPRPVESEDRAENLY